MKAKVLTDGELAYESAMRSLSELSRTNFAPYESFIHTLIPASVSQLLVRYRIYTPFKYAFPDLITLGMLYSQDGVAMYPEAVDSFLAQRALKAIDSLSRDVRAMHSELDPDSEVTSALQSITTDLERPYVSERDAYIQTPFIPWPLRTSLESFNNITPGSLAERLLKETVSVDELLRAKASRWDRRYRVLFGVISQLSQIEFEMKRIESHDYLFNLLNGSPLLYHMPLKFQALTRELWNRRAAKNTIVAPLIHAFRTGLTPGIPLASLMERLRELFPVVLNNLAHHEGFIKYFTNEIGDPAFNLRGRFIEDFMEQLELFEVLSNLDEESDVNELSANEITR